MKFKIDENLPREVAELFRKAGYDAMTVHEQKLVGRYVLPVKDAKNRLHSKCSFLDGM